MRPDRRRTTAIERLIAEAETPPAPPETVDVVHRRDHDWCQRGEAAIRREMDLALERYATLQGARARAHIKQAAA